ncbi:MAG: hypothetical protein RL030_2066, partial [Pseudomonadota bacterium]
MTETRIPALWLCAVLSLAAGCETPSKKADLLMEEFVGNLQGSYDNLAQSRLPGGEHAPLKLLIVPVDAPT